MVKMKVCNRDIADLIRIHTEKEIFGGNYCGIGESSSVKRFKGMKNPRNCTAFKDSETAIHNWYWLQNLSDGDQSSCFVCVDSNGSTGYTHPNSACGVRLVFLLA